MKMQNNNKGGGAANNFDTMMLRVASPDRIREWSFGEVTKPETINYRTQRSEKSGLFDEKIFGPEKDYECYCGKYRGIRYRGIVCEKCGVEITRSIVRRERMGHIELASPVSHIWFLRSMPSRIALILGIPSGDLEKVIYFAGYIITKVFEDERKRLLRDLDSEFKAKVKSVQDEKTKEAFKQALLGAKGELDAISEGSVLDEVRYHAFSKKYGSLFEAGIGAEAVFDLLRNLDLPKLEDALTETLVKAGNLEREKVNKRLSLVRAMRKSNTRPEWMFLTTIPVIPPALRPMVPLDGGRYATSDVNDLYRRVINRNNRLRKLLEISAPEVILRNEKRILQEAVDSLIDNSIRHGSASQAMSLQAQRRQLKSISDNLKGKRGLFRQNLLGKRVDYSGRSVIVVGPDLHLNECGLPKHMALELFRPFVISKLLERELAYNIRGAGRLIEDDVPEVWAILEEIIKGKYVLLNRAPTLHRLGIQAFKPVLIEGNAIRVHPLVCTAFNADFDGDQMAVHVPLSEEAQLEAREIMASDKNILKPGSGDPIISAKMLDIILGVYWVTKVSPTKKGPTMPYEDPKAVLLALDFKAITIRSAIKVLAPDTAKFGEARNTIIETTPGRLLFNELLPDDYPYINKEIDRKAMAGIIDDLSSRYGIEALPAIMDRVKLFGFHYATVSGTTWGIDDVVIPAAKKGIVDSAKKVADEAIAQYNMGLLSAEERHRKVTEIWHKAKHEIEKVIPETLDTNGSVYDLWKSGARGSISQITQMAGMKGLIAGTAGETIEFPILSSMKEGLTPIEYFITTHGSRKGLTDTALNTARAGYLTRRLFDVAQDAIVCVEDCGTKESIIVARVSATGIEIPFWRKIKGRILAEDVKGADGKVIFKKDHILNKADAITIDQAAVTEIRARSPLTCEAGRGVCAQCYGFDLGKDRIVDLGEAIGTVAAQAIGEPGTQLTMRTFHAGGTASVGGDITQGLPRVEEVFEKRKPKNPAVVSKSDGVVVEIREIAKDRAIIVAPEIDKTKGKKENIEYALPFNRVALVKVGDSVIKGQILTDGSADIDDLFKYGGKDKTQNYIIEEVNKLYELQGEAVSRKHIEVIVRQMFSRRRIKDAGSTGLTPGELIDGSDLEAANTKVRTEGLAEAKAESLVMGITEVSLSRTSFLSAASFQHTTRVLIAAAVRGTTDTLRGLKENVIIGRLIPAGTGFPGSPKHRMIMELQAASAAREEAQQQAIAPSSSDLGIEQS
jgi:DNA-directed RNA polymerase subunit beta'